MWSKSRAGSSLALVPSSTRMPQRTHRGWPEHYPIVHPWSEVRYRPTHRHTKLLSLEIPYVTCLSIQTQPMWALTDTGRGYHLGALNFRLDHSSSFPSSILPFSLIALPGLQLCQYLDHLAIPHRPSIDRKGPIMSGFQPIDFYRLPIQLSRAYYRCLSFICVNKVV
jgi:hypothetical protein